MSQPPGDGVTRPPIRVFLLDDHELVRRGLQDLLQREPDIEVVGEAGLAAGAAGYVLKQVRGTDFVDAVRRVAAGQSLLDPAVTRRVLRRLQDGRPQRGDPRVSTLTEQERRILDLVAEGLTNRQIGDRLHLAEKTVKNYVSSVLGKLGMERRTQAAVFAARLRGN